MSKPVARLVVVSVLEYQLRQQSLPFADALRDPASGPAWLAGETWRGSKARSFRVSAGRSSLAIVEVKPTWSKRPARCRGPATGSPLQAGCSDIERGGRAICGPQALDLDHRALAAQIFFVEPLGDDSIPSIAIEIVEPLCRLGAIVRARRNDELSGNRGPLAEALERGSLLCQGGGAGRGFHRAPSAYRTR